MNIPIELCGHKAKLTRIFPRAANLPWQKEDALDILVVFDEPYPESIISTAIHIPVKVYTREELVETVKKEGEKQIAAMMAESRERREKSRQKAEHEEALKTFAEELQAKIEGETNH